MKRFLNKKILLFLVLFMFFILMNCTPVRAEEVLVNDDKYNSSFISDYLAVGQSPFDAFKIIIDYYHKNYPDAMTFSSSELPSYGLLIKHCNWVKDSEGNYSEGEFFGYTIYFTSVPLLSDVDSSLSSSDWALYCFSGDSEEIPYYFWCNLTPEGMKFSSNKIEQHNGNFKPKLSSDLYCMRTIIASNYDVYGYIESPNKPVFQQPTLGKATVLAPVIQKEREKGTLQTVLKEIILIIPLIIVVVVSFLGLRKALQTLFQVLHRS